MATPRREPRTEREAQDLKRFLERGATTSIEPIRSFPVEGTGRELLRAMPLILAATGAQVAGELKAEEDRAMLELELTDAGDIPVLVFVNRPDATASTPPTERGFVGALGFFCHREERAGALTCVMPEGGRFRFRVNITRVVRDVATSAERMTVNLIPFPIRGSGQLRTGPRLTAGKVDVIRSVVKPAS